VSRHLTHGRIAIAGVGLVTVAVLVVIFVVLAPRWENGRGGTYAPKTTVVHTEVTPARSFFGQVLTAHAHFVVDPRRVDPASIQLRASLRPYHVRTQSRRVTSGLGRATVVDFRYEIQCISRDCVPLGAGRGASAVKLPAATASYRGLDGAAHTRRVTWPEFGVQSRLTADEIALSTPHVDRDSAQPRVTWVLSPALLGGVALVAAALLVAGAGWLTARALGGSTRLVRAPRIPAHLTPVERALTLA
jgi:hypothetical protein